MLDGRHEAKPHASKVAQGGCPPTAVRGGPPKDGGGAHSADSALASHPGLVPSRATLRRILEARYPTSTALDAFILDSFFDVYRKFSAGMETTERINLLLSQVSPAALHAVLLQVDAAVADPKQSERSVSESEQSAGASGAPAASTADAGQGGVAYAASLVFAAGVDSIDLLALLSRQGTPAELSDLDPVPVLGGFRSLRLHRQGSEYHVTAFPSLLTRDGEQSLPGGLFVQSGAQRSSTALYLPSGRSGPGYIVSLDVQAVATVTLRRRDVSLTFRVEPAFVEVNRA